LNLIADYMTFEGGYRPLNRMGITSNASPLLKMSFETSMNFMTDACLHGENDDLKSPSSRIVMGQVVNGGTGSIQLLQPVVEHVTPKLPDMFEGV
jgi:DNA-directed RNA polymerase I subunit RPA1